MILKNRYTYIFIFIYSFLFSNESQDDLFYNYYILNGSPSSTEFDNVLENDYEYNLIHEPTEEDISNLKREICAFDSSRDQSYVDYLHPKIIQFIIVD